jgi:hypothetical protein
LACVVALLSSLYYCNVGNPLAFAMGRYPSSQLLYCTQEGPRLYCGIRNLFFTLQVCIHVKNELLNATANPSWIGFFVASLRLWSDPSGSPFTFAFTTSKMSSCHVRPASLLWCNILQTVCWYKVAAKPASVTSLVPMNRPSMFQLCIYGSNSPLVKDLGLFFFFRLHGA